MGLSMAGRIRSVKPEWLLDERMSQCSSDARVLSIALILMADDYGNGRYHRAQMAPQVFTPSGDSPEDLVNCYGRLESAMRELLAIRFVGLYVVESQHYFAIRKWAEHQKVSHPGKPLVPSPPESLWNSSGEPPESLRNSSCLIGSDLIRSDLIGFDPRARAEVATETEDKATKQEPEPGSATNAQVTCPPDLVLTDAQRGSLETSLIPGWAIDAITASFVAAEIADENKKMPLVSWRKCLAKAIASNWNDSKRRPKKPDVSKQVAEQQEKPPRPGMVWHRDGYWYEPIREAAAR